MRNIEAELDEVKIELQELSEIVRELCERGSADARQAQSEAINTLVTGNEAIARVGEELSAAARNAGSDGIFSFSGYFSRSAAGSMSKALWVDERRTLNELLDQDDEKMARILDAFGHRQRLALVRELFGGAASAAELVEKLNMGTTGQLYHHLNALHSAGVITQTERGQYALRGDRAAALMALLSGAHDLLHDKDYLEPFPESV